MDTEEVREGYDVVAQAYHERFRDELDSKPFDQTWLNEFGKMLVPGARVVEVGCGDGHVADYLFRQGIRIEGLDLASEMVAVAQTAYPHLNFECGDILRLPYEDNSFDAIVSFYSIVNLDSDDCRTAFLEIKRVLRARGLVTIAFHVGDERLRMENWWDTDANLDFFLHPIKRISEQLVQAKQSILEIKTRAPYSADVESQTTRAYVLVQSG